MALAVSSLGWFLSAREGRGIPVDCYSHDGRTLAIAAVHGRATLQATFSVAEEEGRVVVGYWEEAEGGVHLQDAFPSELTYGLVEPLGEKSVVDPSGAAIQPCTGNQ